MEQTENLLSTALVAEVTNVSGDICTQITDAAINDEFLEEETTKLQEKSNLMLSGLGTVRGKSLKEDIDNQDALRDNLLSVLIMFLKAFVAWATSENSKPASKLLAIIRAHGNDIRYTSLEKETALIDSILGEFEKAENVQIITMLNLTTLVAELKSVQTQFKELSKQSINLESGKADAVAPSSIRRETIDQINLLINYINVMTIAKKSIYEPLSIKLATLVNELNSKIRTRQAAQLAELTKSKNAN